MTTEEYITALFSEVDEQLRTIPKHPEALSSAKIHLLCLWPKPFSTRWRLQ
jgi:hypothetical protein